MTKPSVEAQIKNYERSYRRMWDEIYRARAERDAAIKRVEAAYDLAVALRHDLGNGLSVTEPVYNALHRVERSYTDNLG